MEIVGCLLSRHNILGQNRAVFRRPPNSRCHRLNDDSPSRKALMSGEPLLQCVHRTGGRASSRNTLFVRSGLHCKTHTPCFFHVGAGVASQCPYDREIC